MVSLNVVPLLRGKMGLFKKKDKRKEEGSSSKAGFDSAHGNGNGNGNGSAARQQRRQDDGNNNGYEYYGSSSPSSSSRLGPPGSANGYGRGGPTQRHAPTASSAWLLAKLPQPILERIFAFVCPHARDDSYETCEQSAIEDACMLCDLRDLAHCVAVCRRWRAQAIRLLYRSIRIDAVHYCDRELYLSDRRKRRTFFDRNGEPEDPARARLKLLCRTLRDDPTRLGPLVLFLKTPYMLRESSQADLARTIAVLPNLRYVDLPEGMFMDDGPFLTLRLEVQARCRDLRKMTYMAGSEGSLQALASGTVWPQLEVLELTRIHMDPAMLRHALAPLVNLRALKIADVKTLGDELVAWNDMLPPFPALEEFILTDVPHVTAEGLKSWMVSPEVRQTLKVLTLNETGVKAWMLPELLAYAAALKHLSIYHSVAATMPVAAGTQHVVPISSESLETLHYEIKVAPSSPKLSGSTTYSYYDYLAGSLLSGGLPNLRAVYVRERQFPDMLLGLPPPAPSYAEGGFARPGSSRSARASVVSSRPTSYSNGMAAPAVPFAPPPFAPAPFAPAPPAPSPSQQRFLSPSPSGNNQDFLYAPPPPRLGHRSQGSLGSLGSLPGGPSRVAAPNARFSSNNPFAALASGGAKTISNLPAKLEVFTKDDEDEMGWSIVKMPEEFDLEPPPPMGGSGFRPRLGSSSSSTNSASGGVGGTRRTTAAAARPTSIYGLGADAAGGWRNSVGARRSVLVGAADGAGFLAVPAEPTSPRERRGSHNNGGGGGGGGGFLGGGGGGGDYWPRPMSSAGEKKRDRMDLWR